MYVVVDLLFVVAPIVCGFFFCIWSLFCCAVLSVISGFAIISLGKRERERERDGCLKIALNAM